MLSNFFTLIKIGRALAKSNSLSIFEEFYKPPLSIKVLIKIFGFTTFNLNEYVSPAFNSMFIAFTLAYLYLPMQYISGINYPVILFITGLLVLDAGTKITGGCTTFGGVALGTLVGFVLGLIWFIGLSLGKKEEQFIRISNFLYFKNIFPPNLSIDLL